MKAAACSGVSSFRPEARIRAETSFRRTSTDVMATGIEPRVPQNLTLKRPSGGIECRQCLGREPGEPLADRREHVEDHREAADVEDLPDRGLERGNAERAPLGLGLLGGQHEHAQPHAADVLHAGEVEDHPVLALGQVIAMPFCTMLLADMGARVIKVESRERGRERVSLGIKRKRNGVEERVPAAQYRDRNKLAVTLELKTPRGIELFKELVRHYDVVTENFSVGMLARLGLGYEDLKRVKPDIVYASITAFGQHGPYAAQRGYDMLAQAISGYMSITGFPDQPPTRSGQSISDYYAGMLCAFSIVSALHYRQRTGMGQHIDLALLDSLIIALDNLGERYTVGGELLTRAGNVSFGGSSSGVYPTTDGHVAISTGRHASSSPASRHRDSRGGWRRACFGGWGRGRWGGGAWEGRAGPPGTPPRPRGGWLHPAARLPAPLGGNGSTRPLPRPAA